MSTLLRVVLAATTLVSMPMAQAQQPLPRDAAALEQLDATLAFLRARNARDYAITSANGIDEAKYVEVGGIEQWITIRGEDRNNPVVLFLHGGPGDATNPWGYAAFRLWLKHFTVVQWDQRGAGRTLGKSGAGIASTITVERMTQDGVELAQLLRQELRKERILLVGHSFGSIVGVMMAKARPDVFSAYVGTAQVADSTRNYAVAYSDLLKKAEASGDRRALDELKEVGPPPYTDGRGFGVQRKWSNLFEGADMFLGSMLGLALTAPGYSAKDINDWLEGQSLSAERLVPQTRELTSEALSGQFKVPVFVIQGADDFTTPVSLARDFVDRLQAPKKEFVTIPGGHFAVFMQTDAFLRAVASRVQPFAR